MHSDLGDAKQEIGVKDGESNELASKLEQVKGHAKKLEETIRSLETEITQLKSINQENVKQLDQLRHELSSKTSMISKLEGRVSELEPLAEAVEQEKLRRIKVIHNEKSCSRIFLMIKRVTRIKPNGVNTSNCFGARKNHLQP